MIDNELRYFIAVSFVKGLGHINAKKLIAACGGVEAVFSEKKGFLSKLKVGQGIIDQLSGKSLFEEVDKELNYIEKNDVQAVHFFDKNYPYRLKQCEDAPLVIYTRGDFNLNPARSLAVVGTRSADKYGFTMCENLINGIKNSGAQIISGLAEGIDTCAHRTALKNGLETIAVLGHGMHRLYPYSNFKLSREIMESGGLLTDFPTNSSMVPANFPSRNRVIAGLSDATLVIQSGSKGGSLITADLALSYNREVYAVPGRTSDSKSAGCNLLIKEMKAALVENEEDLISNLNWSDVASASKQQRLFHDFTTDEQKVLDLLRSNDPVKIDDISLKCQFSINKTAGILLSLEFKNAVSVLPGKRYLLAV